MDDQTAQAMNLAQRNWVLSVVRNEQTKLHLENKYDEQHKQRRASVDRVMQHYLSQSKFSHAEWAKELEVELRNSKTKVKIIEQENRAKALRDEITIKDVARLEFERARAEVIGEELAEHEDMQKDEREAFDRRMEGEDLSKDLQAQADLVREVERLEAQEKQRDALRGELRSEQIARRREERAHQEEKKAQEDQSLSPQRHTQRVELRREQVKLDREKRDLDKKKDLAKDDRSHQEAEFLAKKEELDRRMNEFNKAVPANVLVKELDREEAAVRRERDELHDELAELDRRTQEGATEDDRGVELKADRERRDQIKDRLTDLNIQQELIDEDRQSIQREREKGEGKDLNLVADLARYNRSTSQKEDRMSEHNGSIEQVTTAQKNVLDPRDLADRPGGGSPRGLTEQEMDLERAHYAQSDENRRVSSGVGKRIADRNQAQGEKSLAAGKSQPPETTVERATRAQERLDIAREARLAKEENARRGIDQRKQQERGMVA